MSKKVNHVSSVVNTLKGMMRNHSMIQICNLTPNQTSKMLSTAIHKVADEAHVEYSTVESQCVRENGFSSADEFFVALIKQICRIDNTLLHSMINHMTKHDNSYEIESLFDLPFGYAY